MRGVRRPQPVDRTLDARSQAGLVTVSRLGHSCEPDPGPGPARQAARAGPRAQAWTVAAIVPRGSPRWTEIAGTTRGRPARPRPARRARHAPPSTTAASSPGGARGHGHRHARPDAPRAQGRQRDRGGGVGAAVEVAHRRALRGVGAGAGGPGQGDELLVLGDRARRPAAGVGSLIGRAPRCSASDSSALGHHPARCSTVPTLLRRPAASSAWKRSPWASTCGAGDGHPAQVLGHQARRRSRRPPPRRRSRRARRGRRSGSASETRTAPSSSVLDLDLLGVVLVGDLADDLLEEVLDGDQTRRCRRTRRPRRRCAGGGPASRASSASTGLDSGTQ